MNLDQFPKTVAREKLLNKKKHNQTLSERSEAEQFYTYNAFYPNGNKHFDQTFSKIDNTTQSMISYNPDGTKLSEQFFENGAISSVINHIETGITFVIKIL